MSQQKSFYHDETETWASAVEGDGMQPSGDFTDYGKITPRQEKDIFFGAEDDYAEGIDSAYAAYVNFVSLNRFSTLIQMPAGPHPLWHMEPLSHTNQKLSPKGHRTQMYMYVETSWIS